MSEVPKVPSPRKVIAAKKPREVDRCPRCGISQLEFAAKFLDHCEKQGCHTSKYGNAWSGHLRSTKCEFVWETELPDYNPDDDDVRVNDEGRELKSRKHKKKSKDEQEDRSVCPGCGTLRDNYTYAYMKYHKSQGREDLNPLSSWNGHWRRAKAGGVCPLHTWLSLPLAPAPVPPVDTSLPTIMSIFLQRSSEHCAALRRDIQSNDKTAKELEDEKHECDVAVEQLTKKRKGLDDMLDQFRAKRQKAMETLDKLEASLADVKQNITALGELS